MGLETNLVDAVWGKDRPPRPDEKVKALDVQFAGKKFEEKIEDLRKELEKKKSAGLIVCMLQLRLGSRYYHSLIIDSNAR